MTQEQKDLLLKDICSRLPYKVKCEVYNCIGVLDEVTTFYGVGVTYSNGQDTTCRIDECKPYLFPLSSMTEEQRIEYDYLHSIIFSCFEDGLSEAIAKLYNWFNKNHFDHNNLIPSGLANDCTNLNIY